MKTPRSEYDRDYKKMHYDQIAFRVKKGKREEYQQAANDFGLGLSEMIRLAVETYIADRSLHDLPVKPAPIKITPEPQITKEQRAMLEEISKLPVDTQKALLKFLRSLNGNAATTAQETE